VKERLIGAAVLVAAAVILIPEMLSGPQHEQRSAPASRSGEPPLKTYTIDLSQSPAVQGSAAAASAAPQQVIEESMPPTEDVVALPEQSAASEPASPSQTTPESAAPTVVTPPIDTRSGNTTPAAEQSENPPAPAAPEPSQHVAAPPVTPPVSQAAAPPSEARSAAGKGWAVQLGSFASQATAAGMIKDLRGKGYQDAFVMPVKSGSATLYRVRIGPLKDRQSALDILGKVKEAAPGAAVVPHP
jgi:DedD protein